MAARHALRCLWITPILAGCRSAPPADLAICLRKAEEAMQAPDWTAVRAALEEACQVAPRDVDASVRRAETLLRAYGEIDSAEEIYLRLMPASRPRALHGMGLCALWRGEEDRALDLMRASLAERPTPDCARDFACRLLGRGDPDAERALDVVERVAAGSLRGDLLLAAVGRERAPAELPQGWSYGLERARFLDGEAADRQVEAYLDKATANGAARARYAKVLERDFRRARNPMGPAPVKE